MKKIFLVVSIISVLFLAGCNTNQKVNDDVLENNDNQNQEVNIEGSTEDNIEPKIIKKIYEDKELVLDNSYTVKWGVGDFSGEEIIPYQYDGNVLFVNIDSEAIGKFNSDFEEIMKNEINNESNMSVHRCKYYINDNVLSIVVSIFAEAGGDHLESIYNFDIYTGEEISSKDILNYKGISEETVKEKLPELYTTEFLNHGPQSFVDGEWKSEWTSVDDITSTWEKEAYNKTIDEIPTDVNEIPMYLDENSNLHIWAGIERIAGETGVECYDVLLKELNG